MTAYLLDTNHLSCLITLGHPLRDRVFAHFQVGDTFSITAPILHEFLFGIRTLPRARLNLLEWNYIKKDFVCYSIEEIDAEKAADLRLNLRRKGHQLAVIDSFIAIVALRYDLTLLTTDGDYQRVPGLQRENWRSE